VPDAFEAACARALAVDPKARFADIDELWTALEAAAGHPGDPAAKRGGTAMMAAITPRQPPAPTAPPTQHDPRASAGRVAATAAIPSAQPMRPPMPSAPGVVAAGVTPRPGSLPTPGFVPTPPPGTLPPVTPHHGLPLPTTGTYPPPHPVPAASYGASRRRVLPAETHPVVWVIIVISLVVIAGLGTCVCSAIHGVAG
jgi:hypothetical protein